MRYHINANGDVKPCRATKRACRYGGEQSHYSTLEDAQKAYEAAQQGSFSSSAPVNSSTTDYNEKEYARLGVNINKIGQWFSPHGDFLNPVEPRHNPNKPQPDIKFLSPEPNGFQHIGYGAEHSVYVDGRRDFVYKVPSKWGFLDEFKQMSDLAKSSEYRVLSGKGEFVTIGAHYDESFEKDRNGAAQKLQESYISIDPVKLQEEYGLRLAKTYFYTFEDQSSRKVPVVVQEYLGREWSNHSIPHDRKIHIERDFPGINDIHSQNVKINEKTGEIVLIDWYIADGYI